MSKTERAEFQTKYNMKNMRRFNGWLSIVCSLYIALLSIGHFIDFGVLGEIKLFLFIPMVIGATVYYKKSKRLRNAHES